MRRHLRVTVAAAALPLIALTTAPAARSETRHSPGFRVVVNRLDNPRGLAAAHDSVYVAEAGHGDPSKCLPDAGLCLGLNGAITRVSDPDDSQPETKRVVTGLISVANDPSGIATSGVSAVSLRGHNLYALMSESTSGLPATTPAGYGPLLAAAKTELGQLLRVRGSGTVRPVAGVGDFDFAWTNAHKYLNPQFPDANPNAVLTAGHTQYVVDAGSNTLDAVKNGRIKVLAYFGVPANSPTDAVPTCISRGPDGALYVGELLGGQFAPGHARVWRVVPGHAPSVWATGLTAVNGCGWGPDGKFYAVEFQAHGLSEGPTGDPSGDVVQINRHGVKLAHLGVGQLFTPSGFAASRDAIFVSNCSISPAAGFGPCPNGGQLVSRNVDDDSAD